MGFVLLLFSITNISDCISSAGRERAKMNTPYFHVLLLAVQSSVAVSRTRDHETYTEKGTYIIFEQKMY